MLRDNEAYRRIKPVDIASLQRVAHLLRFKDWGPPSGWLSDTNTVPPPEFDRVVSRLGLGGKVYRQFCRKLMPGEGIAPHIDDWIAERGLDIRRFQVPVITHPDIVMRWPDDGVEVHLEPGWLYEVRFDRMHEVVNRTDCERIHIQIDQMGATI